jgi:hypothetical protein
MKFLIKFKNFNELICNIKDTAIGQQYYNLVQRNYHQQFPVYRDRLRFTRQYLSELAEQVNQHFGWSWTTTNLDLSNTAIMHKDIEQLVGDNFDNVPEHLDDVVHDLHLGLHLLQDNIQPTRDGWFQIEWYNDSGFTSSDIEFSRGMSKGDLKLQNPFVGHGPLQIYLENDYTNISQTCKFHTFVKPGINIATRSYEEFTNTNDLIQQFEQHDPAFVVQHGTDKILSYTGYPIIGRVENIDLLEQLIDHKELLELDSIEFA